MRWQETARGGTLYYPIWLAYATGLIEEQHDAKLVDAPARRLSGDDVVKDAASYEPDLVVIDTSYTSWRNDIEVAARIKQSVSKAFTVVVGPPTSAYSLNYLRNPCIDAVIEGEYEFPLRQLADALQEGKELREIFGLSWKDNEEIRRNSPRDVTSSFDLENLPWVSRVYKKHLNVKDYFLSSALYPEVQIIAERGCPHMCTFCEWPQLFTKHTPRYRTVENVVDEMLWIRENLHKVKEIVFEDDTFTINKKWVHDFCDEIIKEDLEFTWSAQIRADVEYDLLRKMRKAGCRLVIVGFESGSDKVLRVMKKGITVENSRNFARAAKRAGILIHGDFIIGMPGETERTIEETWSLIHYIRPEVLQVSLAAPFPGTEFYEYARRGGYLLSEDPGDYLDSKGHQKSVLSYPGLSASQMESKVDQILKRYYLSVGYLPLILKQVLRSRGKDELLRLLASTFAFLKYTYGSQSTATPLGEEASKP